MSNGFKDKVIVVTGAASGIGAAICNKFAQEGARIVLMDMDEEGVKAAADQLKAAGVDAVGFRCDVVQKDECRSVINQAMIVTAALMSW